MNEEIKKKLDSISNKVDIIEKDLTRVEKHLAIVLGVILFLIIFIFIGIIKITEEVRPDIFDNWATSLKFILGFICLYGIYRLYKYGHKLAKNEIQDYLKEDIKISPIRKAYIYITQYFETSFLLVIFGFFILGLYLVVW